MITEVFYLINSKFPQYACRHHLTFNDKTGTLGLGVWVGSELRSFELHESELANPTKLLFDIEQLIS